MTNFIEAPGEINSSTTDVQARHTSGLARVRTDEFTAAINRIEARRAKESAQASAGVNVEQTIRELRIDASSDEVIREIAIIRAEAAEAERLAQAAAAEKLLAKRTRRKRIAGRIGGGFALVLIGALIQYGTDQHNYPTSSQAESLPNRLASLGNGQERFVSTDDLQSIISAGGSASSGEAKSIEGARSFDDDTPWAIVKSANGLSLYGYVDSKTAETPTPAKEVLDSPGANTTLVAIPLAGVNALSSRDDSITLANLPPRLYASPGKQ